MELLDSAGTRRDVRTEAIDRLVKEATERGDIADRMYWTLVYDFEMAPMTTNHAQLTEAGVVIPEPELISEAEVPLALWRIVEALAQLDIYLLHTDHLDDRGLLALLCNSVLEEQVRDLPPGCGVHEFIDLAGGASPDDREVHLAVYATDAERAAHQQRGGRVPPRAPRRADRDRHLPRPSAAPARGGLR